MLIGCTNTSPDEQITQLALTVKKTQYETDGTQQDLQNIEAITKINEKIKPYLTDKAYELYVRNREGTLPVQVSSQQNARIAVKSLSLEKQSEANGVLTYHYTMELELVYAGDTPSKVIKADGQMDVVKEGDTYKVSRDWDGFPLIQEYHP